MASVSGDKIMVRGEKKFDLFYAARERLRNVLFGTMREEEAAVCYAMLTGDGSAVENGLLQNFRYGGVAHIFAVSGLHIGVIYAILSFLLKRIRMPKLLRCALIFAPLLFYVGVCRFSPSSVRALVMCTVLMFSNAAGLKYDALNSVALAALAVLIINPVYLFGVGFLLSVSAAGGIIVLGGTFTRAFQKIRSPRKLASSAGVCLAAQISTFPLLLDCFGYVSALSLVTNLLFIPVISAIYAFLFAFSLLACVIPAAAGALLYIPELLVSVAVFPLSALDMKILLISGFSFGGYIALWYFVLAVMSDKINLRAAPKAAVCSAFVRRIDVRRRCGKRCVRNGECGLSQRRLQCKFRLYSFRGRLSRLLRKAFRCVRAVFFPSLSPQRGGRTHRSRRRKGDQRRRSRHAGGNPRKNFVRRGARRLSAKFSIRSK